MPAPCASRTRAAALPQEIDPSFLQALHPDLSRLGKTFTLPNKIVVPSLETLAMMKAAALPSRCGEKDLFDLLWITRQDESIAAERLIELGQEIDAGMTAEGLLISLAGADLSEESCGFSIDPAVEKKAVFAEIEAFRKKLIEELITLAEHQPTPALGALVKRIRRMKRG